MWTQREKRDLEGSTQGTLEGNCRQGRASSFYRGHWAHCRIKSLLHYSHLGPETSISKSWKQQSKPTLFLTSSLYLIFMRFRKHKMALKWKSTTPWMPCLIWNSIKRKTWLANHPTCPVRVVGNVYDRVLKTQPPQTDPNNTASTKSTWNKYLLSIGSAFKKRPPSPRKKKKSQLARLRIFQWMWMDLFTNPSKIRRNFPWLYSEQFFQQQVSIKH